MHGVILFSIGIVLLDLIACAEYVDFAIYFLYIIMFTSLDHAFHKQNRICLFVEAFCFIGPDADDCVLIPLKACVSEAKIQHIQYQPPHIFYFRMNVGCTFFMLQTICIFSSHTSNNRGFIRSKHMKSLLYN